MKIKKTMKRILQTMGLMGIIFGLQLYTAQVYGSQALDDSLSQAVAPVTAEVVAPVVPAPNGGLREWLDNPTHEKMLAFYIMMLTNKLGSNETLASAKAALLEKFEGVEDQD